MPLELDHMDVNVRMRNQENDSLKAIASLQIKAGFTICGIKIFETGGRLHIVFPAIHTSLGKLSIVKLTGMAKKEVESAIKTAYSLASDTRL